MRVKLRRSTFGRRVAAASVLAGVFGWASVSATAQDGASRFQTGPGQAPPALAPLPTPAPISPGGAVVEDVIVRVNDQIISRSDVERAQQQLAQDVQQHGLDLAEGEKNLLRDMIDQQLLLSKGKELGINADADLVRRLDDIRKQNNLPDMEALEKAARSQGVSFEDFKAQIRNSIVTQQVVRDEVGRRLQLTQAQEQAYYDAHKQDLLQPEQVRLSEILVPAAADADEATLAKAKAKADGIAARIKAGEDFAVLAKKESGGPTASQGGDLGLFKRGALAKVLEDQTFPLPAGGSTEPIRTRQGFVILKVTEHQEAGAPPLKQIEPQIQEAIYSEQIQPALRAYLKKLREESYIDIKPGFVDSGASGKETKPVFTAYAPPTVKAKKTTEKQRFDRTGRAAPALASSGGIAASGVPSSSPGVASSSPGAASTGLAATAVPADGASSAATTSGATTAKQGSPNLTLANVSAPKFSRNGKQKKVKREKIRYGQGPRNSLPPSQQTAAVSSIDTLGSPSSLGNSVGQSSAAAAAANPLANVSTATNLESSPSDADPLAPKVVRSTVKTRFSSREPEVKAKKVSLVKAKVVEKAAATPTAAGVDEKASRTTQSAPLGLNGDTAKKKKRAKRVKGTPKERLQDKAPASAGPAPEAIPLKTDNPNLGSDAPAKPAANRPTSDSTTLPPADAPAPGALPQGNVAPAPAQPTLPPPSE